MARESMKGRVCVVTGANTGIGEVTARELARDGATVILACRNEQKTRAAMERIKGDVGAGADLHFQTLDLGDLASVRACAKGLLERGVPIHVLINNAGLAGIRDKSSSGFEIMFGVNHLGHFLLTLLLLDHIKASGPARIINVASKAHYQAEAPDWKRVRQPAKSITGMQSYAVSKLCNILFTRALAKRLEGSDVTTYCLHPGVVASDIWRRIPGPFAWVAKRFMITNEQGALTTLHCARAPLSELQSGGYYDERTLRDPSPLALDDGLGEELWRRSSEWVGL